MEKIITLPFCSLKINNHIVIGTINDGVHLTIELTQDIVLAIFKQTGNHPTVYIANRIHSYSVDPTLFTDISKIKNIIGFGVICPKSRNADIESLFYKNTFKQFKSIDTAILWAEQKLKYHSQLQKLL